MVGFDCGNSSYRVVLGKYDGIHITTEVIDQIQNDMIKVGEYYYWDILRIFADFKSSLKKLISRGEHIDSIGICTWGVDFALFDAGGNMLNNPMAYRNSIGEEYLSEMTEADKKQMFQNTGILCDKINSVYLLQGMKKIMPSVYNAADKLLMIPDILNYMMTGKQINEPSEFSTTQLLDVREKAVSGQVCYSSKLSDTLFCSLGKHGEIIGYVTEDIRAELGIDYDIPVVCVPSHDTAAAVLAVPAREEGFVFISSGTWALVGTELRKPIVTDAVYQAGLTNELGAFDTVTLLKNGAGMFLIQRIKKEYEREAGHGISWEDIVQLSKDYEGERVPLIDVNSSRFFNPRQMGLEIWKALIETGQVKGAFSWSSVVRAVYESMACSYAVTFEHLQVVTGQSFDGIYIVGGGARNEAVNQMTANCTGKKVIACFGESTAMGNIAAQLRYFNSSLTLRTIREIVDRSVETKSYAPEKDTRQLVNRYQELSERG